MASKAHKVNDGLTNILSGAGTSADKSTWAHYTFAPLTQHQAEAAYRTSWLTRKIVDLPARDMTREWRDWQADNAQIEALERFEKTLMLRHKVTRALILSRLHGGGALILGVDQGLPGDVVRPDAIGKGGLRYVHAVSRHQLSIGPCIMDPESPWFGEPLYYQMSGANGGQVKLHPSRVVAFVGQPVPEGSVLGAGDWFWGDPIMQIVGDAIRNADRAQSGFAALIEEAAVDIIGIPDLMTSVASAEYEAAFMKRMNLVALGKSTHRALIHDAAEEWSQRQVSWTGMPDMITSYLQIAAGAADIPLTRLLGTSPKGLQSTGDGEERDYISKIVSDQGADLRPRLERFDDILIRSALGSRPPELTWQFAPIAHSSPKALADIEKVHADTAKVIADSGLVPEEALAKAVQNRMIESGSWPGFEAALDEANAAAALEPEETDDPSAMVETPGNVVPIRRAANDAAPRTLYVSRQLRNAAQIIAWAKSQGFETTVPAFEMHVTVAYSRVAVDWMAMGNASEFGNADGVLTIPAGGPRLVEPLGDKGAIVLLFNSWELSWRHGAMREKGASWDFPEFQPHITISYAGGPDPSGIEPYRGEIVLGPEIFAEVDDTWSDRLTEA